MDPEATLRDLRAQVQDMIKNHDRVSDYLDNGTEMEEWQHAQVQAELNNAYAIAEKFEALDQWLTNKGFKPSDWA